MQWNGLADQIEHCSHLAPNFLAREKCMEHIVKRGSSLVSTGHKLLECFSFPSPTNRLQSKWFDAFTAGGKMKKIPEKYSMRQIERLPHLPDPGFDTLSFVSRFTTLLVIPVPWIRGHAYARLVG